MSDQRINLALLREQLGGEPPDSYYLPTRSEALALVEAVEAARQMDDAVIAWAKAREGNYEGVNHVLAVVATENILALKLARFDFGGRP